mmetsp:Transcript_4572/g.18010  ORF Transcript_4572/g.18010 Transcript_4572/m.18010 type:complete len:251 (-) Transcript_4572:2389-3141(-)
MARQRPMQLLASRRQPRQSAPPGPWRMPRVLEHRPRPPLSLATKASQPAWEALHLRLPRHGHGLPEAPQLVQPRPHRARQRPREGQRQAQRFRILQHASEVPCRRSSAGPSPHPVERTPDWRYYHCSQRLLLECPTRPGWRKAYAALILPSSPAGLPRSTAADRAGAGEQPGPRGPDSSPIPLLRFHHAPQMDSPGRPMGLALPADSQTASRGQPLRECSPPGALARLPFAPAEESAEASPSWHPYRTQD